MVRLGDNGFNDDSYDTVQERPSIRCHNGDLDDGGQQRQSSEDVYDHYVCWRWHRSYATDDHAGVDYKTLGDTVTMLYQC